MINNKCLFINHRFPAADEQPGWRDAAADAGSFPPVRLGPHVPPVRGIGEPVRKADTLRKPGLSSPAADLVQSASEGREQRSTGTRAVRSARARR